MALSFFRALNPASKNSGINYSLANKRNPCQGTEMIDYTFPEIIGMAINTKEDLNYFDGLGVTYKIIVGNHYDLELRGQWNSKGGRKGALDYLIFPLIARKLIADSFLDERQQSRFFNTLALAIAIPLELVRLTAAIALTLLLAPIVALVHIIKACLPKNNAEQALCAPGMSV